MAVCGNPSLSASQQDCESTSPEKGILKQTRPNWDGQASAGICKKTYSTCASVPADLRFPGETAKIPARMQSPKTNVSKILIRGTNWLGDAVMTTPALRRLRASFPDAHLALLATPRTAGLFEESPFLDEVILYRRREEGIRAFWATVQTLRNRQFDLAALFQNAFEAALLTSLAGIPQRVGFVAQGRSWLLTGRLYRGPQHRNRHQIHDYLDIVALCERLCLGAEFQASPDDPLPVLTTSQRQRAAAEALRQRYELAATQPLVALNTAATNSRAKCWPEDRFAALADELSTHENARVILIGAESERANAERVVQQMKTDGALNLAGRTSMAELLGLLESCALLVTNDTGPAHVAAALGRPTLTLFGPTNEFETAPAGPYAELMRADGIECARCMHRACPIDHRCMTRLTVADVFSRARSLLRSASAL